MLPASKANCKVLSHSDITVYDPSMKRVGQVVPELDFLPHDGYITTRLVWKYYCAHTSRPCFEHDGFASTLHDAIRALLALENVQEVESASK